MYWQYYKLIIFLSSERSQVTSYNNPLVMKDVSIELKSEALTGDSNVIAAL